MRLFLPAVQVSLSAVTSLTAYHWTTPWGPCTGLNTLTTKMWVQPGIQFNLSGATPGQAFVHIVLTAKK